MLRFGVGVCVWLLISSNLISLGFGQSKFLPYAPLSSELLFSSRVRFHNGIPIVSIGVSESADTVVLVGKKSPIQIKFSEGKVPKTLFVERGTPVQFRVANHQPAERRWWVRVEEYPESALKAAMDHGVSWASSKWDTELADSGALLALGGHLLDTRRRQLLVGGYRERPPVEQLSEILFEQRGIRGVVRPTLLKPASGTVEIFLRRKIVARVASGGVSVGAALGAHISYGDRSYAGRLYILPDAEKGLTVVNSVDAETLLQGIVPAEIFASAPSAALQAQAIVARGAILSLLGARHFDTPFHLCDDQHCQVYKGAGAAHPATNAAILATRGMVATRPESDPEKPLELVESVYSASCGGHTEGNATVWDEAPSPSLQPRLDGPEQDPALLPFRDGINAENLATWLDSSPPTYCARSSLTQAGKFRWTQRLGAKALADVGRKLGVGPLVSIQVLGRGRGGRVTGVRVRGVEGQQDVLRELPVRRLFNNLNSGAFQLKVESDANGVLTLAEFKGAGWGHGVGMCQMGAIGRAEAGQSAAEILRFYYSGAELSKLYK